MPISFFKHLARKNSNDLLRIVPPALLSELVEGFYVFKSGCSSKREIFFNDGYPVIAFMDNRHEEIKILMDGQTKNVGNAWVCGGVLKNIYSDSKTSPGDCLVVRFYAATFFKSFGITASYFQNNQIFDFSEIAGQDISEFKDDFYHSPSVEARLKILISFLSKKIAAYAYPKLLLDIQKRIESKGKSTVKEILNDYQVRLSYKWLERNFKKHLGISPQNYLLMQRFLKAYIDLDSSASRELLQVAIDHGYYDDNHFIKDFRKFSGLPPKTYFNRK